MKAVLTLFAAFVMLLSSMADASTAAVDAKAGNDPVLLGDQHVAATSDGNPAGLAQAFQYVASTTGTATDVEIDVRSGSTASAMIVGLYSNASGQPSSLLGSGSTSTVATGWDDVTIRSASITAGTTYWIAVLPTGGTVNYFDTADGSGTGSYISSSRSLTTLPSTYTTGTGYPVSPASMYVNGTLPPAPANTALPSISGTPQQGDILTASPGTWSGDTPQTYTYAWSDGATGQSDTLGASDVGQTITVTVTASDDASTAGTATSASVGPVTAAVAPTPAQPTNCAGTAGSDIPNYASMDACGFPSPVTTGVPSDTTLTASGSITANTAGEVINGLNVTGSIQVNASNVTIENTEISSNSSSGAIQIGSGVTGVVVKNDTIHGTDSTSSGNLQAAVYNTNYDDSADAVTVDHVDFYDGQRILHGPGTLTNSFCLDNETVSGAHYECVYEGGGSVTIDHNTLLTAQNQTAAIYLSTDFGSLGTVTVTDNLLAGGGYALYGGALDNGTGVSSETVTGNRFSPLYYADGGYYGPDAYMPTSYTWSGNVWDDTGALVSP